MDSPFPIKIKVSKAAREEFEASEYGSFEDANYPKEGHVVNILRRWKTVIEVRDATEADIVFACVCSGTFQLDYKGFLRTARKIADALRPYAKPETVALWKAPSGY